MKERQRAREALDDIEFGTPEFGLQIALPHTGAPPSFTDAIAAAASLLSDDGWELTEVKTCHHVGSTPGDHLPGRRGRPSDSPCRALRASTSH